ncbi:DUF2177 family protein [Legionella impletisoli]|uniref:Membrane protein n=1 Tax=Legionella impletisoli TaxID=343510 RepID=A0A917JUG0_9GAMM|nr:DUF2177 family protein [Legionella impletisoli]GGI81861.1 membrane protein [Legionella impletisoli]
MHSFKLFITALLVFCLLDLFWLGYAAKSLYFKYYGSLLRLENGNLDVLWWAALIVYCLFAIAIVVFVIPLAKGSLYWAILYGGLLGIVTYGVYDFTCLAVFKNMPIGMAFVDWAWGAVICALTSFATVVVARWP